MSQIKKNNCPNCQYTFHTGFIDDLQLTCPHCKCSFINPIKAKYPGTNATYYREGCPALMEDNRIITNYLSSNYVTNIMMAKNGFKNAQKFRTFLQSNGKELIDQDRKYFGKKACHVDSACSIGWYQLWNDNNGNWANFKF